MVQDHHALGAGAEPLVRIEFLERFLLAVLKGDQAHEQHHGGGILPCGVQPHVGVGGTGAASHHGHAGNGIQLAVRIGHVGGTALVAGDHSVDGGLVEAVQHIQVALAGHHVGAFHAVGHK